MFASGSERIVTDFGLKLGMGFKVKNPHSHQLERCGLPSPWLDHMFTGEAHSLGLEILTFSSEMEQPVPSMERIALWRNISNQRQPIRYLETGPGALQ